MNLLFPIKMAPLQIPFTTLIMQQQQRQSNSAKSVQIPQHNWLKHVNSHKNFSSQAQFLTSNFLFSLPIDGAATTTTSIVRQGQNVQSSQRAQVDKAWSALSRLQLSGRSYVPIGKSVKVTPQFHENRTTTSFQGSYENDKLNHPDVAATPTVIYHTSRVVDS